MIALGSDHAGFPLKEEIKKYLEEKGIEYKDYGCYTPERFDYAIAAQKACDGVVSGECDKAVLCCGTESVFLWQQIRLKAFVPVPALIISVRNIRGYIMMQTASALATG